MTEETRAQRRRREREEHKFFNKNKPEDGVSPPSARPLVLSLTALVILCTTVAMGYGGQELMQLNASSVIGWVGAGWMGWAGFRGWRRTKHLYKQGRWRWFFGVLILVLGIGAGWLWVSALTLARDTYAHAKLTGTYPALTHSVAGWKGQAWDENTCQSLGKMQDDLIDQVWSKKTPPSKIDLMYLIKNEAILYQATCNKRWVYLYGKAKNTYKQASWDGWNVRRAKTTQWLNDMWPNEQAGCLMEVQRSKVKGIVLLAICDSPVPSEEAWLPEE